MNPKQLIREALRIVVESFSTSNVIRISNPDEILQNLRNYGCWYHPGTKRLILIDSTSNGTHGNAAVLYMQWVIHNRAFNLGDAEKAFVELADSGGMDRQGWVQDQLYLDGWVRIMIYSNQFGAEGCQPAISDLWKFVQDALVLRKFAFFNVDLRHRTGNKVTDVSTCLTFNLNEPKDLRRLKSL